MSEAAIRAKPKDAIFNRRARKAGNGSNGASRCSNIRGERWFGGGLAAMAQSPRPGLLDRGMLEGIARSGLRHVARVVELLHEGGVDDRDVIPLEVVVHVDLPVALDDPVFSSRRPHRLETSRGQPRGQVSER